MATTQDFVDHVFEQTELAHRLSARKMFGEFALYLDGKVVALDSTDALIRRISGSQMVLRLKRGSLPDGLKALVTHPEELLAGNAANKYTLRVNDYKEVEPILATLRASGAVVDIEPGGRP